MRDSMSSFISSRRGGRNLRSAIITGPGWALSQATHCRMMRVDFVRLLLAQIPGDARSAQHRTGEAQLQRALRGHHADVDGALLPDAVVGEQRLVVIDALREALGEGAD